MQTKQYKHKRKGGSYRVQWVAKGSGSLNTGSNDRFVVYRNEIGHHFVRPFAEFMDVMEEVFEEENKHRPPDTPLERVVTERAELLEKIDRLGDFISSDKFVDLGEEHGRLMRGQLVTMEEYAEFLNWRIELMQEVKK